MRKFKLQHRDRLFSVRPYIQEENCTRACKAEVFASHFGNLAKLLEVSKLDAVRVWSCNETNAMPERNVTGRTTQRKYFDMKGARDLKIAEFKNAHRVTMLTVVNAVGEMGPTLFVFR